MSLAVREVSVAKGYDPRDFALVASGGAGPLHVVAIARELHIPTVIVPLFPSHFSALGMLLADERHDFIRTFYSDLATRRLRRAGEDLHEMVRGGHRSLRHAAGAERADPARPALCRPGIHAAGAGHARARSSARDRDGIRTAFDALYEHRYAHHSPEEPVEMVNIRLAVIGKRPKLKFPRFAKGECAQPSREREVYFSDTRKAVPCPVYQRETLGAGSEIAGPALIQEHGTTTVLFERDACTVAPSGELIIAVGAA